jgi:hypothetical protein
MAVPNDFRPVTPDRTICTKFRSIFPLSITRGKIASRSATSRVARTAQSSAGMSFIAPASRAQTAVFATNSASTSPAYRSTSSSCFSAVA